MVDTAGRRGGGLFTQAIADKATHQKVQRFIERMQVAIVEANRAVMSREALGLHEEAFLRLAVRVAESRAEYVRLGISMAAQQHLGEAAIAELRRARVAYEELAAVFDAAERAVERGYVDLA